MIHFHPDDNLLTEYSAGALDRGLAIAVKAHLSLCPQCRTKLSQLNLIGSAMLESETTVDDDNAASFAALMKRIHTLPTASSDARSDEDAEVDSAKHVKSKRFPPVVSKLLDNTGELRWKAISPSLRQANLQSGQDKYEVCLHKIRKGGRVVEHDHHGQEVTLILEGAFSDEQGTYRAGDFLVREPGEVHRPTATQDQDCLCLTVVAAPVRVKGLLGMFVNPFIRFQPG